MSKVLIVAGHGPGISQAVAEKFGAAGFSLALVARSADKLEQSAKVLAQKGYNARAFATDLGDAGAVRAMVRDVRRAMGSITALHWNAASYGAPDLLTASVDELHNVFDVGIIGLIAAVQECLVDLRGRAESAVLVTNGGFGLDADPVDIYAVKSNNMGLAMANAAKHKVSRLLRHRLATEGVYVGEVMVKSTVQGTAWDRTGDAILPPTQVADLFWSLYADRKESLVSIG